MEEKDLIKKNFLKERLICNGCEVVGAYGSGGRSSWWSSDLVVVLTMERRRHVVFFMRHERR
ncbi:hypothetical protein A2U01_0032283, partial [Trifolium medium]|nr:hypothetical protein [Trifolium medium]